MMWRVIVLLAVLIADRAAADVTLVPHPPKAPAPQALRKAKASTPTCAALPMAPVALLPGERLSFELSYLGLRTGHATTEIDAADATRVKGTLHTDGVFDVLGKLDATMVSYLDAAGMPLQMASQSTITTGTFSSTTTVTREDAAFLHQRDPSAHAVEASLVRSSKPTEKRHAAFSQQAPLLDGLSTLYYLRSRALQVGAPFCFVAYHRRQLFEIRGIVVRKEAVRFDGADRNAFRLEATLTRVRHKKGESPRKVTAWLSDDAARLPLRVESAERVGHLDVKLLAVQPGRAKAIVAPVH